jgi:hypothetical protein
MPSCRDGKSHMPPLSAGKIDSKLQAMLKSCSWKALAYMNSLYNKISTFLKRVWLSLSNLENENYISSCPKNQELLTVYTESDRTASNCRSLATDTTPLVGCTENRLGAGYTPITSYVTTPYHQNKHTWGREDYKQDCVVKLLLSSNSSSTYRV